MKLHSIITLTFVFGFALMALPSAQAGDSYYRTDSGKQVRTTESKNCTQTYTATKPTRCDRRCSRLTRMLQRRGCLCREYQHVNQPARAHEYTSSYYPPFRYGR